MIAYTCWVGRVAGLALAVALLTGDAHAESGRAEIKGQVLGNCPGEETLRGLGGVTVELRHAGGTPLPGGVPFVIPKTGEDGKFSFEELPAGEYLLRIFAAGYAPHEAKLYCTRDSLTQLTVRLERSVAGLAPGQKKPPRDPLPGAGKIAWDVRALEESPLFDVVRREVKGRKVTWLLENTEDIPGVFLMPRADFVDADGVTIRSVALKFDPSIHNWKAGERNRLILTLPDPQDLQQTVRIVIARF